MTQKKDTAVKTVGMVMVIMLLGKMTGMLRQSMLTALVGYTAEANAFAYASAIPNNFLDFTFASAISSCFIPVFNAYIEKKGKPAAFQLANNFITLILLLSAAVTVAAVVFTPQVVYVMATDLSPETALLTASLLRIMLPTIVLSAAAFSLTGVLQSLGEFNIPAGMSLLSNLMIIGYWFFFFDRFGMTGLAVAFLAGWGTQVLIQMPSLLKKGYFYKPYLNLKDSGIREIAVLILPVMMSAWILPISSMINLNAVSRLGEIGGIALNNANTLYTVITGVLILSIANVIFPKLSKDVARENEKAFGETLRATLRVLFFLLLPMTAGLVILSEPIVSLVYGWGKVGANEVALSAYALSFYALGMVGFGLQTILSRGFYADRNSKIPLLTGLIAIAVNAALSFTLVDGMGVGGPALATSAAMTVTGGVMLYFMYRKNTAVLDKKTVRDVLKMFGLALVMAGAVYLSAARLKDFAPSGGFAANAFKIALSVGLGVLVYMILSYAAKIEEAAFVFKTLSGVVRRTFNKGKEDRA
ncbi:MAG: murein biosynthesis integral membrane protein MurJ [Clostridiales bacterium]|nr:murein biosynthesis integral membrane protein MurJ [Clostridiales bacterium]